MSALLTIWGEETITNNFKPYLASTMSVMLNIIWKAMKWRAQKQFNLLFLFLLEEHKKKYTKP